MRNDVIIEDIPKRLGVRFGEDRADRLECRVLWNEESEVGGCFVCARRVCEAEGQRTVGRFNSTVDCFVAFSCGEEQEGGVEEEGGVDHMDDDAFSEAEVLQQTSVSGPA